MGQAVSPFEQAFEQGVWQAAKKRDRLPACEHLESSTERNTRVGDQNQDGAGGAGNDLGIGLHRVAHWAYAQTEAASGLTWLKADELVPLASDWRHFLR